MKRGIKPTVVWVAIASACLVGGCLLFPSLRLTLSERISGNNPEARTRTYVRAVLRGDEEAALATWELPSWELPNGQSTAIAERRQAVTREMIAADLQDDFMVHRPNPAKPEPNRIYH